MSTKKTLRQYVDQSTGRSYHVYDELFDEDGNVYIELEGFQFEASTSVLLTGNGVPRLTVKLPREWAQKLGLVECSQEKERDYEISCGNVFADLGLPNPEMYLAATQKARSKAEFIRLCEEIPDTPMANLADAAERARLSASAIQAFVNIAKKWKLTEVQARGLLGAVDAPTYCAWQSDPHGTTLDQETMTRISLVIGIFKALNIGFGKALADQWVTLANSGPLFAGQSPIDFMIERGPAGMKTVRRLLDSWSVGH
jgi:hypothetical protein